MTDTTAEMETLLQLPLEKRYVRRMADSPWSPWLKSGLYTPALTRESADWG